MEAKNFIDKVDNVDVDNTIERWKRLGMGDRLKMLNYGLEKEDNIGDDIGIYSHTFEIITYLSTIKEYAKEVNGNEFIFNKKDLLKMLDELNLLKSIESNKQKETIDVINRQRYY